MKNNRILKQLKGKVTDLRQQLHEAQENKVDNNQHLQELRELINELQQRANELQLSTNELQQVLDERTNKRLANLQKAWYEEIAQQLSRERKIGEQHIEREHEKSEFRSYRAIEAEHVKWEEKESKLHAQQSKQYHKRCRYTYPSQ